MVDTIENGYIEYSDGTVYQSVATYNCHNGHNLTMTGDEMRTCGSDGMWNGTAPMCDSESKFYNMGLICYNTFTFLSMMSYKYAQKFTPTALFNCYNSTH